MILIGLDGLEPTIIAELMARGELPNFARLAKTGGLGRVATTTPAETPVAWSTVATGKNPGGHGIFDFLRRDPKTYLPDLGLNRYEQKNAFTPPRAVNLRRGKPVWDHLTEAGVASTILRCPCTYPPEPTRGRMLSGMGVPDLRGGLGTATFLTTDATVTAGEAENVVPLSSVGNGRFDGHLIGPRQPRDRSDTRFDFVLKIGPAAATMTVESDGSPSVLTLREERWSEWLDVKFKLGTFQSVRGQVRFFLKKAGIAAELFASPIQFHPEAPPFPISSPGSYARELVDAIGPYHTSGMIEDHAALSNDRIDEIAFLDQCDELWAEREAMLWHEIDRSDRGLLYCLFDTPDRVQHMLWRHREPDHPANRGRQVFPAMAHALEEQYTRGDAVLGRVLDAADDKTLVIAMSDHGFGSFRRGVCANRWLYDRGLLALKDDRPPEQAGDFLRGVDWSRTRAYAVGLGGIYLNLQGREGQGIVRPDEAAALKAEIAREYRRLEDPGHGRPVVAVRPREELYHGPYADESPDLVALYAQGYRASWASSTGGLAGAVLEDNTHAWSGDHIIDPAAVPGFLAMNRAFRGESARLEDLAPTILQALGVPAARDMEGKGLLS